MISPARRRYIGKQAATRERSDRRGTEQGGRAGRAGRLRRGVGRTGAVPRHGRSGGAYTQHYFDSRGVVRLYAMTLAGGVWTLTRESPDFTPLDFRQRFTGTFSADGNTIDGAWESGRDGGGWEHDFALTYRRAG